MHYVNFESVQICSGHVEAAIKSYKQALALRPDFPEATCNLLHTLQVNSNDHVCNITLLVSSCINLIIPVPNVI